VLIIGRGGSVGYSGYPPTAGGGYSAYGATPGGDYGAGTLCN